MLKQRSAVALLSSLLLIAACHHATCAVAQTAQQVVPSPRGRYVNVGMPAGGLTYRFNPMANFTDWTLKNRNIYAGDVLLFQYPMYSEEVYAFTRKPDFINCNYLAATRVCSDTAGVGQGCAVRLSVGTYMLSAGFMGHCQRGQRFSIRVLARPYTPKTVPVGYISARYRIPGTVWNWNSDGRYGDWLKYNRIYVGDKLVFRYPKGYDEVYIVPTLADYTNCIYSNYISYCNSTDGWGAGCFTAPLEQQTYYFISGVFAHCKNENHKIAIPVLPPPTD